MPKNRTVVVKMRRRDDTYAKIDNLILSTAFLKGRSLLKVLCHNLAVLVHSDLRAGY